MYFHSPSPFAVVPVTKDTTGNIKGKLSSRAFKLISEWATLHQSELMENWELARDNQTLNSVLPLE
ncbi:MAG: DUF4160 domain-containing protein [Nostoc sp.]